MKRFPGHPARRVSLAWFLLAAATAGGCVTTPSPERAPEQVTAMVECLERIDASAAAVQQSVALASQRLQELLTQKPEQDAALAAYARFVQSIEAGEQEVQQFAAQLSPLQSAGEQVFARWRAALASMQSERLRQRSELRLAEARERFGAVVAAAAGSRQQAQLHLRSLRDHALFFAHDLNPSAFAAVVDEAERMGKANQELERQFAECRQAARAYVEQATMVAALPSATVAEDPAAAPAATPAPAPAPVIR